MSTCIKACQTWLERHPKVKQWCWFVSLWLGGLLSVTVLTYPIKLLIKLSK